MVKLESRNTRRGGQAKYGGNKPSPPRRASRLGEIVNPAVISTYFTEPAAAGRQRGVYFNRISLYYFTKRSGVCFYSISIVFLTLFSYQIQYSSSNFSYFERFNHPVIRAYRQLLSFVCTVPTLVRDFGVEQTVTSFVEHRDACTFVET